ncbi:MAG: hypothetical protein EBZ22_08300 [Flavobacteriia bacterium]|nr:hypothetical protein [Flavobacteriia bacterium]
MKINGKEVTGKSFAFDGCHKIYVCESAEEPKQAESSGYGLFDIEDIEWAWERSCPLRFISNWALDKTYVAQGDDAVFEEGL